MTDEDRLGPPPVEPMTEAAWARVERGLWSRLDAGGPMKAPPRPPRRWWMIAVPLAAAAAAALVVLVLRPGVDPVDGRSRVETIASGSSVSFGESYIEIDAYSALELEHDSGRPTVMIERGAAWFTVAPRQGRSEFVVRAGEALVRVVGTRFRVARGGAQIAVEVDRGLVAVQFRGGLIEVAANQRWSSAAPARIATLSLPPAGSSPAASNEPEPEIDLTEDTDPAEPVAPKRPTRPAKRDVKPLGSGLAPDPQAPTAEPGIATTQPADDLERREYERLARLEPLRPEDALNGYLVLARGTSRWSDLALFAAARLAADRKDRRAESLLVRYLQQFPSGANAADAKQLLARLKAANP
jgi:hypothetical protein